MASASSLPCEEQSLCSICLDGFTQPVTTPCGHNYCKACITGYWDSSDLIQCPLCKKKFRRRPQLQVNTEFRDMVERFNNMRVRSEDQILAKPGEVPCDICLELKLKAQKTCVVCLASYCQSHLEPHHRVTTFKKHKLIDPVSNLEDRVCKRHGKMFELFCHTDQMCVCFMCLKDNHVMHEAVPLENVFRERKAQLEDTTQRPVHVRWCPHSCYCCTGLSAATSCQLTDCT
uniref:RING-type domain-containing protein n=1 Tax=Seriola lalandi dorsalis TaxID=1841481 RepID=A0A3B4X6J6_SERLL